MKKPFTNALLLLFLALTFIVYFYGPVLLSPNSFLFSSNGDAIKNYYTYAFFIENNISNIEFEGMNYPYMENFMYTDCHPLQASILKAIHSYFPVISNYSIGILNLFLIFSLIITIFILYLIFIKLKINQLLSVFGALAITILSPQLFRLTGHLALSYSFFIPLIIYLLMLFESKPDKKHSLYLLLAMLFFFFTHAYLGMIASVLVFVYSIVGLINNQFIKRVNASYLKYIQPLGASIMAIVIFYVFVKLTDSHIGRTTNPWGIFENHAQIASILLPVDGPLNGLKNTLFNGVKQPWEGWAYIGIIAIISIVFYIFNFTQKKYFYLKYLKNDFITQLFITSILFFCLSTLLPFRSIIFKLVDSISMIKQFRSIGRFAWAFYFITNILAIFIIDKMALYLKEHNKKIIANSLIVLLPMFIAYEGISYHKNISQEITKENNLFSLKQLPTSYIEDCKSINANKYQAIISLPFFYIGSDNYGKSGENDIYKLSFIFSYHLNLPMVNSYLSRTGIAESKNIMQLLGAGFYNKEIEKDIKSNKPFLIICGNKGLSIADKSLLNKAKLLIERDEYSFYEVDKNTLFENNAHIEFQKFNSKKATLFAKNAFMVSDTSLYFSYTDFDQYKDAPFNKNNACFNGLQKDYSTIFSIKGSELNDSSTYIARFWMYNNGDNFGQDCLNGMIFFTKTKNGKEDWIFPLYNARESHDINGNWSLTEAQLTNIDKEADYSLLIKGSDISKMSFYIDHLLFYDHKLDIYKTNTSTNHSILFHNNHTIEIAVK